VSAVHLLLPQLAGLEATAQRLTEASPWILALLVLVEATSLAAYGELMNLVLSITTT
jgi:hypothetical protein